MTASALVVDRSGSFQMEKVRKTHARNLKKNMQHTFFHRSEIEVLLHLLLAPLEEGLDGRGKVEEGLLGLAAVVALHGEVRL